MAKPIKLSPQHGVNPCISVCFFCHEDKEEIRLLGKLPGDTKAPMRAVLDYQPCEKCKAKMRMGVSLIGVKTTPNNPNQPPIQEHDGQKLYPTGSFVVIKPDAIHTMISNEELANDIIKQGATFVDESIIDNIIEHNLTPSDATNPSTDKA